LEGGSDERGVEVEVEMAVVEEAEVKQEAE
jgi:hypothetical protein